MSRPPTSLRLHYSGTGRICDELPFINSIDFVYFANVESQDLDRVSNETVEMRELEMIEDRIAKNNFVDDSKISSRVLTYRVTLKRKDGRNKKIHPEAWQGGWPYRCLAPVIHQAAFTHRKPINKPR